MPRRQLAANILLQRGLHYEFFTIMIFSFPLSLSGNLPLLANDYHTSVFLQGYAFSILAEKKTLLRIKFEIIASTIFPPGFSTFRNVRTLRERLSRVRDSRIWLLEIGTPIPEEFQVINDRGAHVKILPSEHAPVTVGKFQEVFITIY